MQPGNIDQLIGIDAFTALEKFSGLANKSMGSSHQLDRDRWCDFLIKLYRNGVKLDRELLKEWLIQEGWSSDMASNLACEFDFARDLLKLL
jgi:hypothetical protein